MLASLPDIPVIDARRGGSAEVIHAAEPQLRDLFRTARRTFTPPVLAVMDRVSHRWLQRTGNPYRGEIAIVAEMLGKPGAYALNVSYEWACTCGVGSDGNGRVRLLRVLDWRQQGLGRNVVVARQQGPAGEFANITWPGYVGVITAMAPGRFAVAINQPPVQSWSGAWPLATLPFDWVAARIRVWRSHSLPPPHLLRQVCETCPTYEDAKTMLAATPLCLPAFFTLAGTRRGEGCVIERTATACAIREMPAAVGNHWVGLAEHGRPRGRDSRHRQKRMEGVLAGEDGDWLVPPILNSDTRVVAELDAGGGRLVVQGWERNGAATARLAVAL
jgi:hypothetical protein